MVDSNSLIAGDDNNFALTALITVLYQLIFFVIAASYKFDKVTDLAGGTNFILNAWVTFAVGAIPGPNIRQLAASVLVTLWGVRLSGFLFYRIMKIQQDERFDELRDRPLQFLGFWFFQMLWVWVVSLPVTYVNSLESFPSDNTQAADVTGIVLCCLGLIIETWADASKFSFRQDPENKSKWCDVGLWHYSRHPNYFGEILFWWGMFSLCSESFKEDKWAYVTVLSPLFVMSILLGFSGVPLLEASANRRFASQAAYQDYRSSTSILILFPPQLFKYVPYWIKVVLFFEWPMYGATSSILDEEADKSYNVL